MPVLANNVINAGTTYGTAGAQTVIETIHAGATPRKTGARFRVELL